MLWLNSSLMLAMTTLLLHNHVLPLLMRQRLTVKLVSFNIVFCFWSQVGSLRQYFTRWLIGTEGRL